MGKIKMKRVYETAAPEDGFRILVDRLWPRGVKKEAAKIDLWLKTIAPSPELRKWFGHQPERFAEFQHRYLEELKSDPEKQNAVRTVIKMLEKLDVTLVYAAKNEQQNHAIVLKEFIHNH